MTVSLTLKGYLTVSFGPVPVPNKVHKPEQRIQQQKTQEPQFTPLQIVDCFVSLGGLRHCATRKNVQTQADGADVDRRYTTKDHGNPTIFLKHRKSARIAHEASVRP